MEQEPIKLHLPDAGVFLKNLEDDVAKLNDKCLEIILEIISERLGITKEEAQKFAEKVQEEAMNEYIK